MMLDGKHPTGSGGFTIVETLIVLAVTSVLFVSAVLLINGRQSKAEFQTGANNMQQKIEQVLGEISSGYYPNSGTFNCQSDEPLRITAGAGSQGTRGACVFIGKVFHFGAPSPEKVTVYSLAGKRLASDGSEVTSYAQAWPTAISQGFVNNNDPTTPNLIDTYQPTYGLALAWASVNQSGSHVPATSPFGVAVMSSLATYDGGSGLLTSGSQQFKLFGFSRPWATFNTTQRVTDNIDEEASLGAGRFPELRSVELCFASGGTNQSVLISISSGLAVTQKIYNGKTCS